MGVARRSAAGWLAIAPILIILGAGSAPGRTADALAEQFRSPPSAAAPRVWWHWMNGNVTEEGIALDLQWMKRIGIGGVQNFDGAFLGWGKAMDTPVLVDHPLIYMTPPWWRAFRSSVELASTLGLEFTIASSAGWTTTGGPWVQPQDAMKKLVWSETWIEGGRPFKGQLNEPPHTTGNFQNIPVSPLNPHWKEEVPPVYYADIATVAYRMPSAEIPLQALAPKVTSSSGTVEGSVLFDGDLARTTPLTFDTSGHAWIQFAFAKPVSIQALTLVIERAVMHPLQAPLPRGSLEASDEHGAFRKIADLPQTGVIEVSSLQQTLSFTPWSARTYRLVFEKPPADTGIYNIAELVLHTGARVNRFEDKAGYSTRQIRANDDTPEPAADALIRREDVVDLTSKVRPDGSLQWTPSRGRWVVLRFGYSLTGKVNDPASRAGTGLEVDKLNRPAVKRYMDAYLGRYAQQLGPDLMGKHGLQAILVDSYEAGPQNWTDTLPAEFSARRGYDLTPWLPVLTGRVIESASASDRFLWDFRKTLGELMRDAHYEQLTASAHERGLLRYGESQEYRRFLIGDGMEMKKSADIPMGAMWASLPGALEHNYAADLRESASVAHLYGQNLVAAESFTAGSNPYGFAPEDLKPIADRMMAEGVNRFVIHTSVHQPDSRPGPGIGLGPVGQWFTRKETWAQQAPAWVDYLARSSHLLSRGRFVADIAYLYGEDTNVTSLFHERAPPVPEGYGFDFVNADTLLHELSVRDGRLVSRSGMEYRLLVLDASTRRMSLPVLRAIRDLVRAGALVVGEQPTGTPSLADDEREYRAITSELWPVDGERNGPRVIDRAFDTALRGAVEPDVVSAPLGAVRFVHRKLEGGDLYFIASISKRAQHVDVSFRVAGRKPELWRADRGTIEPVSYRMQQGRTLVPLELEANDAIFVVFRAATEQQSVQMTVRTRDPLATIEGPWEVRFPAGLGAPDRARFERLRSWTENDVPGIRYFSGTATYTRRFTIGAKVLDRRSRVELDLGEVKNVADVQVNGRSLGVLWKAPFRLDITDALQAGENAIEINVTNLWPNRLIGDKQPDAQRIAFAAYDPFEAGSPLMPSGLLGPVTLWKVR